MGTCSLKSKHKRGAPVGNRNALKHGYYSRKFDSAEQYDFKIAAGMEGITEEIALLRFEIKKAISGGDIKNLIPLTKAALALEKLIRTHQRFFIEKQNIFKVAFENVFRDILFPLTPEIVRSIIEDRLPAGVTLGKNQKTNDPPDEAKST